MVQHTNEALIRSAARDQFVKPPILGTVRFFRSPTAARKVLNNGKKLRIWVEIQ